MKVDQTENKEKKRQRFSWTSARYTQISIYVVITVMIIYILAQFGNHFHELVRYAGGGLRWIGVVLKPLGFGFIFAYLLYPAVGFLQKKLQKIPYFKKRGSSCRGMAVGLIAVIAVFFIISMFSMLISLVTKELSFANFDDFFKMMNRLGKSVNGFYQSLMNWLKSMNISSTEIERTINKVGKSVGVYVQNFGNNLQNFLGNVTGFFTTLIFTIIFAVYFMLDGEGMMHYWDRVFAAITGKKIYRRAHEMLHDADMVFSGYIRGQMIDAVFMGVVVSICLILLKIKFAGLIGILSGVGNLIPYVGPVIAYGSTILVCLITGDVKKLVLALVLLFIIQTIDGNVVNPKLLSSNIEIHPVLVIACLIIGSSAGGLFGMIFAVPIGGFIKLQFDKLVKFLIKKRKLEPEITQVTKTDQTSQENNKDQ
ncbi:MAG: AI-2E family transporter [Lachnospiraceae bacterium]|nr:AI-2E family transporter [Lachnospiraceae bacterium]